MIRYTWTGAPRPWNVIQPRLSRCAKATAGIIREQRDELERIGRELEQHKSALALIEGRAKLLRQNVKDITRTSDMSFSIAFTSCRIASLFQADMTAIAEGEG